jgi:hypothetical protein
LNVINKQNCHLLAKGLEHCKVLKTLDISYNSVLSYDTLSVAKAIGGLSCLEVLDITRFSFRQSVDLGTLKSSFSKLKSLKQLYLKNCNHTDVSRINTEGAVELVTSINSDDLWLIDLTNSSITNNLAYKFGNAIKKFKSLRSLFFTLYQYDKSSFLIIWKDLQKLLSLAEFKCTFKDISSFEIQVYLLVLMQTNNIKPDTIFRYNYTLEKMEMDVYDTSLLALTVSKCKERRRLLCSCFYFMLNSPMFTFHYPFKLNLIKCMLKSILKKI